MNQYSKIPPHAVEVEEYVLGAMLTDSSSVDFAFERLVPVDFYKPDHQTLFRVMQVLHQCNQPIDLSTVEQQLKKQKGEISSEVLSDLTRSAASAANIGYHSQIIREQAIKRSLIKICNDTMNECYTPGTDTYDLVDNIQDKVFKVTELQEGSLHHISDSLTMLTRRVSKAQDHGKPTGLQSGLDIDQVLQGFQGSKLYILGARPSMGKTALAMTVMRRLALDGHRAGIISLETSHEALSNRLVSQTSGIPGKEILSGRLTGEQMQRYSNACAQLFDLGIYIEDSSSATAQQLRSKCRIMKRKKVDIIFIDFLTLIKTNGRNKHEEVGEITKAAKAISKELDIPIVMLAQLSRKVEDRPNKRPQLSDLRESGSIEEDADCVMFLYRPEYYGFDSDEYKQPVKGIAEVIIAKNKEGPTGMKRLYFDEQTMTFKNLDPNL